MIYHEYRNVILYTFYTPLGEGLQKIYEKFLVQKC